MTIAVRAGRDAEDVRSAIAPIFHYFGATPPEEAVANFTTLMGPERVLLAQDGDETLGGCGSFPLHLTTPGGHVSACGVTMVGVMPTHRRRGVLTKLIARLFEDSRVRNEAVAYLWASEERIYGRYGFGLTGLSGDIRVARDHALLASAPAAGAAVRSVPLAEAAMPLRQIFATVADRTPGAFARSEDWWRLKTLADPAWRRRGSGEMQAVVVDLAGEPAAYAL